MTNARETTLGSTSVLARAHDARPVASGYQLTSEEVREFQELIAQETGAQLSTQDAWDRAIELIALVRMLVSPLPEDPER